jgi:hypothetical protein
MEVLGKRLLINGQLIRTGYIDGEGYQFLNDPEAALAALHGLGTRIDLFTFIQKLSDTTPKYPYPMEWDNMAVLPVTTFDDWMKNQINFKVRNKVRKAAKNNVSVREVPFDDALIRGIHGIYNESPTRQGRRFGHYGEDIEAIRNTKATFLDQSIFIGAFLNDDLIGFIKLVANEDRTQAGLMHIISMLQHRDKSPTNALVAQAVSSCAQRGISHLWYAKFQYGKKSNDSLMEFKRANGFQKVDVPRYYVPLTPIGRAALRLGLHRGLADWAPDSVVAVYRKLRSSWYARKYPGVQNA